MLTSTANQQIKHIIRLQKSGKLRKEEGVFLVEGIRMFREIPEPDRVKVYVTEEWQDQLPASWFEGSQYELVSGNIFRLISDTQTPQGILAVVRQRICERDDLLGIKQQNGAEEGQPPCILVLENIQDPGNLGTILRTAEGAGITGIMMSKDTVDVYNSKVVRATMGAIFRVPFCCEDNLMEGVTWLKEHGISCYAAHLKGKSVYEQDYRGACAFFIGNEGNGLTEALAEQADSRIRIPMAGQVESLNAATAATVLMYEALRQRILL